MHELSMREAVLADGSEPPVSLRQALLGHHGHSEGWLKEYAEALYAEHEPWVVVVEHEDDVAVHAALFPSGEEGQVLMFGGVDLGNNVTELESYLYDIASWSIIPIESDVPNNNTFCSGHAFLADGRLLVAGGQLANPGEGEDQHGHPGILGGGDRKCWTYSPEQNWQAAASLNLAPDGQDNSGGRWYPTLVTLGDGRVFCAGGHMDVRELFPNEDQKRHNNNTPEIYTPGANSWTLIEEETIHEDQVLAYDYQRMHVMPDGTVFFSNAVKGRNRFYDVNERKFVGDAVGLPDSALYRVDSGSTATFASVFLPLLFEDDYKPRVLLMGASNAERIDLADDPTWQPTKAREWGGDPPLRNFVMPVILPTGQIFFCGGTKTNGSDSEREAGAVLEGEIYTSGIDWETGGYDPENEDWQTVAPANSPRHYHASALLLPDGSVWTGGSNGGGDEAREHRIEIYRPPYLSEVGRPEIRAAPGSVQPAEVFEIEVDEAERIGRVGFIRNGSFTHAFNSDQRYVSLAFERRSGNRLRITAPPNCSVAPPGQYMLWVISVDGRQVCRRARFIGFND